MRQEVEQLLELEWAGKLTEHDRARLELLAQAEPELASRLRAERRLTGMLGKYGPNTAPTGLSAAVMKQLAADRGASAVRGGKSSFRGLFAGFGFGLATAAVLVAGAVVLINRGGDRNSSDRQQMASNVQTSAQPSLDGRTMAAAEKNTLSDVSGEAKRPTNRNTSENSSKPATKLDDVHALVETESDNKAAANAPARADKQPTTLELSILNEGTAKRAEPVPTATPTPAAAPATAPAGEAESADRTMAMKLDADKDAKPNDLHRLSEKLKVKETTEHQAETRVKTEGHAVAAAASTTPADLDALPKGMPAAVAAGQAPEEAVLDIQVAAASNSFNDLAPMAKSSNGFAAQGARRLRGGSKMQVDEQAQLDSTAGAMTFAGGGAGGNGGAIGNSSSTFELGGQSERLGTQSIQSSPLSSSTSSGPFNAADVSATLKAVGVTSIERTPAASGHGQQLTCTLTRGQLRQFVAELKKRGLVASTPQAKLPASFAFHSGAALAQPGAGMTSAQQTVKLRLVVHE